jgi:hydrogenase maturation factor HypF (carbamoyltransferase family)
MKQLTIAQKKDVKLLFNFIRLYCGAKHASQLKVKVEAEEITCGGTLLCPECAEVVKHALERRYNCPLEPKPSCKQCRIHCYSKDYRAIIREIMAFSGRRMILRGRLDYLKYYFF